MLKHISCSYRIVVNYAYIVRMYVRLWLLHGITRKQSVGDIKNIFEDR
jgi:hypothetical protein